MGWAKNREDKKMTGEGEDLRKDSTWSGSLGGAGSRNWREWNRGGELGGEEWSSVPRAEPA